MEITERLKLVGKMGQKRSQELLSGRDQWIDLIQEERDRAQEESTPAAGNINDDEMLVCVRIRPMLDYELDAGFFDTVHKYSQTTTKVLDPKISVKGVPKVTGSKVTTTSATHSLELFWQKHFSREHQSRKIVFFPKVSGSTTLKS